MDILSTFRFDDFELNKKIPVKGENEINISIKSVRRESTRLVIKGMNSLDDGENAKKM